MQTLRNMPPRFLRYFLECIEPMSHGGAPKRLAPEMCRIKGTQYDMMCDSEGVGVTCIVSAGEQDKQLLFERGQFATEQRAKASLNASRLKTALKTARENLGKANVDNRDYYQRGVSEKEDHIAVAEQEVDRLKEVEAACRKELAEWTPLRICRYPFAEVSSLLFDLTSGDEAFEKRESPLQEVCRRIKDGDAYATGEIRFVLPPKPLELKEVETFLSGHPDRAVVLSMIERVLGVSDAVAGIQVPGELQEANSEPGGANGEGSGNADSVPELSGAGAPAGKQAGSPTK